MPIILNREELLKSNPELREKALDILEAGLDAIRTEKVLKEKVRVEGGMFCVEDADKKMTCLFDLPSLDQGEGGRRPGRVFFVGIGKCALDGAKVMEDILKENIIEGIALDVKPAAHASGLKKVKYFEGTHPYPSDQNVEATKEILKMVEGLTEKDLVITLISGGGSALFELPMPGVTIEDIVNKTKDLTAQGADIYKLNAARKEMSQVKGGKFAMACAPARVVSVLFSDVLGNDISVIASGPTVIEEEDSPSLKLREGDAKRGVSYEPNKRVKNILLVSNRDALEAMKDRASELGFNAEIETETLSGDAKEIGKELAQRENKPNTCVLLGGETTVVLAKPAFAKATAGEGGRNQTMALAALPHIKPDSVLVCAASDGWDNTDHAGALVDTELFENSKKINLNLEEYLANSDSYNFFKNAGGAIYTGKLGSNVSDLCIMITK